MNKKEIRKMAEVIYKKLWMLEFTQPFEETINFMEKTDCNINGVEFEGIGAVYIETSDEQFYLDLTVAQPFYDYKIEIKYKNLKYFSVKNKVIFDKKKYDLKKVKKVEKIDM